jgi:alkylation response protein AidB-like acyl-CoA dehydrogenase
MDFELPDHSERLRARLRVLFAQRAIAKLISEAGPRRDGEEPDPRLIYRWLGSQGLLAVNWPREYGGGGGGPMDLLVLAEEMARHGIPHTLHFISIQIVGTFIQMAGSDVQRRALLPRLAAGEMFVSTPTWPRLRRPPCATAMAGASPAERRTTSSRIRQTTASAQHAQARRPVATRA